MTTFVLAVAAALLFSFLCSISEAVLLSMGHAQIQALAGTRAGRILRRFKKEIDVPIAAILVLNTIANTVGAAVAGATFQEVFHPSSLVLFTLTFATAILLFGEIVPKTLGVASAKRLMAPVAVFVDLLVKILAPVLIVTRVVSKGLRRRHATAPVTSLDEIRLLASLGRIEGAVNARTASIIEGAAALRDLTAYDVMVPRNGVAYLSGERTLAENLAVIRRTGHSRFPFTPDGDLDKVEGVILVKELLFQLTERPNQPDYRALLSPLLVAPAQQSLERLLRTFQEERRHLAVVADEYGGIQGIVTLEDILEEIVGEIEDESDRIDPTVVRRPDGSLVCRGWAETRKIFELLGIHGQDVEVVTIGGFVAELVGRVPKTGDQVEWESLRFKVLSASARRAERIQVVQAPRTGRPD